MSYKRIFEIRDASLVEAVKDEASFFGVTFRVARSGGPNEFVIEGLDSKRQDIDTIVDNIMEMDALAVAR